MEDQAKLVAAYRTLKNRWRILLVLTVVACFWIVRGIAAETLSFILGVTFLVCLTLCYVAQFKMIQQMKSRAGFPRIDTSERGVWYTCMALGALFLAPGTILEAGLFLLYAKKFISNAQAGLMLSQPADS
jgi:hypothetical protein